MLRAVAHASLTPVVALALLVAASTWPGCSSKRAAVELKVEGRGKVDISPGPGRCNLGCFWNAAEGTRVAMVATPAPGWVFSGWSGDCAGQLSSAALVMHAMQRCTVVFAKANSVQQPQRDGGGSDRPTTAAKPGAIPWSRTYGSRRSETAAGIALLRGGDLALAGSTSSSALSFDARLWLARIDQAGAIVWQRSFHNNSGFNDDALDLAAPAAGGLAALARSVDSFDDSAGTHERGRIWLVRLDDDGRVLWQKRYGDAGNLRPAGLLSMASGGFLMTARSIPDRPTPGALGLVLLLCVDASGAIAWRQVVSSASDDLSPGAMVALPDGFLIAVNPRVGGRGTLLRLDARGAIRWQRSYETQFVSGAPTREGGFLLAGAAGSGASRQARLARLDARGAIKWQESLSATDLDVSLWSVTAGAHGDFLIAGTGRSTEDGLSGSRPSTPTVHALLARGRAHVASDAVLVLIGDDGAIRWQRAVRGPELTRLVAGVAVLDGFVLAGTTGALSDLDIWTLGVAADGALALAPAGDLSSRATALRARSIRSVAIPGKLSLASWPGEVLSADSGYDNAQLELRSEAPARAAAAR